jgi:competence protein ComEC
MPFMAISVCLILGIAVSRAFHQYSFACLILAALALIAAAILALRRERCQLSLFLTLAAISLGGCLLALAQRDSYSEMDLRRLIRTSSLTYDNPSQFEGCVIRDSNVQGDEIASTVDLRAVRTRNGKWAPCRGAAIIRWPLNSSEEGGIPEDLLRQGDRVRGSATFRPPRNYQNPNSIDRTGFLERRGIFLLGRVKSAQLLEVIPGDCSPPWEKAAVAVRQRIQGNLNSLILENKQKETAILASIVVGDYSDLDDATRESFLNSGTYHALVVSGLHVALLAGALLFGFRLLRVPMEYGRALSAFGILFYTCIVGFQASISRCLWMFVLYLSGKALFRKAEPTNLLLACGCSLLAVRPNWLFDVGFQLSFLSVTAISLMAAPLIESRCRPLLAPLSHCGDQERLFLDPGGLQKMGRRLRVECELWVEAWADRGELLQHSVNAHFPAESGKSVGQWKADHGRLALDLGCSLILCKNCAARGVGYSAVWTSRGFLILFRLLGKAGFQLASMVIVSLCVQLWLEMLLAFHYNRLSWVAPLANLLIVPLSSLALGAGLVSALAAGIPILSQLALKTAAGLASLLFATAKWMSALPGAWQRCPTPILGWVITVILILAAWCFFDLRRLWISSGLVAASLLCLSIGYNPWSLWTRATFKRIVHKEKKWDDALDLLKLTFLDVGEGDAIVIEFPNRRIWVLDSGGIRNSTVQEGGTSPFDVGEAVVSRYLWGIWAAGLDRLLLSHADQDHAGGMTALIRNFRVWQFNYSGGEGDLILRRILEKAANSGANIRRLNGSDRLDEGGAFVEVVNPISDPQGRSRNEDSMALLMNYRRFSALLTGDLEKSGETDLVSSGVDIHGLVLKVAHHGSRFATSDTFLERVACRWAIVSAGRNNPFGHPSRLVLLRLLRRGVRPLLTLDQGAISIKTDGQHYSISSHVAGILETGILP